MAVVYQFAGVQWLSGRVLYSRPKGRGFEPHWCHFVVSLSKNINPSLVLVQPRKTRPFITERLLMGRKESNQTNKQIISLLLWSLYLGHLLTNCFQISRMAYFIKLSPKFEYVLCQITKMAAKMAATCQFARVDSLT